MPKAATLTPEDIVPEEPALSYEDMLSALSAASDRQDRQAWQIKALTTLLVDTMARLYCFEVDANRRQPGPIVGPTTRTTGPTNKQTYITVSERIRTELLSDGAIFPTA